VTRYANILQTVGNTPAVKIGKLAKEGVDLYVKIEAFNPLGSVKDRLALGVIEEAEHTGALKRGQTVMEATSGNTGIGLAMVCAQKGYPVVVTMTETYSVERRKLLRFLGAEWCSPLQRNAPLAPPRRRSSLRRCTAGSSSASLRTMRTLTCIRELAQKEGIFVGITAGATFAGALQVCKDAPKGSTVLCMLPDTGERYLSTPLFADIPVDMTEEELRIMRSSPSCQMQVQVERQKRPLRSWADESSRFASRRDIAAR
jgi:cysteine synthase